MSTERTRETSPTPALWLAAMSTSNPARRSPAMATTVHKKADAARLLRLLVLGSATAALIKATLDMDPNAGHRLTMSTPPAIAV